MTIWMIPTGERRYIKPEWLENCTPPEVKYPETTDDNATEANEYYRQWDETCAEIYNYARTTSMPRWLANSLLANRGCTYDRAHYAYDPIDAERCDHRRRNRCTPRCQYVRQWFAETYGITDPERIKEMQANGIDAPDRRASNGDPNFYEIAQRAKEDKLFKEHYHETYGDGDDEF